MARTTDSPRHDLLREAQEGKPVPGQSRKRLKPRQDHTSYIETGQELVEAVALMGWAQGR